jgi:hypothetical protein
VECSPLEYLSLIEPDQVFGLRAVFVRRHDFFAQSFGLNLVSREGQSASLDEVRVDAIKGDGLAQGANGPLQFEAKVVEGVAAVARKNSLVIEGVERRGPAPVAPRGPKSTDRLFKDCDTK